MTQLQGCQPEPLSGYLKALGILRILAEQGPDPQIKGYWQKDCFYLVTSMNAEAIVGFFLNQYQPTPLVAPWNASTGFYEKDRDSMKATIVMMRDSGCDRLKTYRDSVNIAQKAVDDLGLKEPKDGKSKLLKRLRNTLPDEGVRWLDTCALIGRDDLRFPPLTGTGGNDGNFEFSRSFMQQLQELFDFGTGEPIPETSGLLKAALFGETLPGLPFNGPIGQFNPIAAGGVNATPGYMAEPRVNPWEYVLMLEGILLFTAALTRRYESSNDGSLSYPFMVRPSLVGYGSAADDNARAELWAPLWGQAVGVKELQVLFNEGRAKLGGRTARDGVDFVARGITSFVRYSFQERNGLAYFAIPLGRIEAKANASVDRLVAIDAWRDRFRRAAQDDNAPNTIKTGSRRLETVLYEFSVGKAELIEVLIVLGEAEKALGRSMKFTIDKGLRPLWIGDPKEASAWVDEVDDQSSEFRLALALAGSGLRQRLVQVRQNGNLKPEWIKENDGKTIWTSAGLIDNLLIWMQREEVEQGRAGVQMLDDATIAEALNHPFAGLEDIEAWLNGSVNPERLEAIARGLCLVQPKRIEILHDFKAIPADYALLKLVHHRHLSASQVTSVFKHAVIAQDVTLPRVPTLLTVLARGDGQKATALAIARLRSSRLRPALDDRGLMLSPDRTRLVAAALAFPLGAWAIARLLRQVRLLEDPED
jgi:CRISPR-associated protein Csx17